MTKVFAYEGDVGCLDDHVAAHGAHGDADVGGGQGWGVVDAVADHRGRPGLPETGGDGGLVLGPKFGVDLGDPGMGGESGCGAFVVAGEHGDRVAAGAEPGDHLGGFGAQVVADADGADDRPVPSYSMSTAVAPASASGTGSEKSPAGICV